MPPYCLSGAIQVCYSPNMPNWPKEMLFTSCFSLSFHCRASAWSQVHWTVLGVCVVTVCKGHVGALGRLGLHQTSSMEAFYIFCLFVCFFPRCFLHLKAGHCSLPLQYCFPMKQNTPDLQPAWGWVDKDWISIVGWTIPLIAMLAIAHRCYLTYRHITLNMKETVNLHWRKILAAPAALQASRQGRLICKALFIIRQFKMLYIRYTHTSNHNNTDAIDK